MPITTKAGPMPTHQRLRTDDGEDVQDRREPSVELDEKPTVGVRQPRPILHLAPQNNALLPERCILRLKSALRLEWRSQDAQHKEDQRYYAAGRADSLTPPTRMRFSAHTSPCAGPLAYSRCASSCRTSNASRAPPPALVYSSICRSPVELPKAMMGRAPISR